MENPLEPIKKKTNGRRNRSAGINFEQTIAKLLRDIGFPHVITSRAGSKHRDDQGVDLMNAEELVNGRLPYNIQCKNTTCSVNYAKLLASMPQNTGAMNVIFHKFTELRGNSGFHPRGHYAILNMQDFLDLIGQIELLKKPPQSHDGTN